MASSDSPAWLREPRILTSALTLPPLLVGLEGVERLEERDLQNYLHRLFAVVGKQRSWADATEDYLDRRDYQRAARCAREAKTGIERRNVREMVSKSWNKLRDTWQLRLVDAREERNRLDQAGAEVGPVDEMLDEVTQQVELTDDERGPALIQALSEMEERLPTDVEDALELMFMALEDARTDLARRQKKIRVRLRELKRAADGHLDEMLWWDSDEVEDFQRFADAGNLLRLLLNQAVMKRDLAALEQLKDLAERLEHGERDACSQIEALHAPQPISTPRRASKRTVAVRLSHAPIPWTSVSALAQKQLQGALSPPSRPVVKGDAITVNTSMDRSWEIDRLTQIQRVCQEDTKGATGDQQRLVRAHFLLATAKLELMMGNGVWARILFADGYRWASSSARALGEQQAAWRAFCTRGLLMSIMVPYLSLDERLEVIQPSNLDVLFLMRVSRLFLVRLEQMKLYPRVALALQDMEAGLACGFFREYLAEHLGDHPTSAEDFLHTLLASRSPNLSATFGLFSEVFHAIHVPFADAVANEIQALQLDADGPERAKDDRVAERIGQLREFLLRQSEWTDFVTVVDRGLQTLEEHLRNRERPSPELNIRLLTPVIDVGLHDYLVLELHYLRGARTLSDIRVDVGTRSGEDSSMLSLVEHRGFVSQLLPGDRREVRIYLQPDQVLDGGIKLEVRAFEIQLDGGWRELRNSNLALALQSDEREPARLHSPYTAGTAVTELERIFGRDEQIQTIIRALIGERQDNAVLVLGERRIGKTTLLEAVTREPIIRDRYLCVRVDLEKIQEGETVESFYHQFLIEPVRRSLKENGVPVPVISRRAIRDNPAHAFGRFMDEVDRNLTHRDGRLLIILDEFEKLLECIEDAGKPLDQDILATLRAVIISRHHVSFILCGVTHVLRRHTARQDSRLFQLAVEVELRPLERVDAEKLIREPARPFYGITPTAVDRIVRETGRQPYLVQYVCHQLFQHMLVRRPAVATAQDVDDVLKAFIRRGHAFSYLLDYLDKQRHELEIIQALAQRQYGNSYVSADALPRQLRVLGIELDENEISERLVSICERAHSVCERKLTTREFRLSIGMFAAHLRARRTDDATLKVRSADT